MDDHRPEMPLDELLEETAFLRRLARRLVTSEDLADDVVQDTWLRVIGRPGSAFFW